MGRIGMGRRSGKAVDERNRRTPPPMPEPLRVPVADSHTHMDMQTPEVGEIITTAESAGVTPLVQVGVHLATSRSATRIAAARAEKVWAEGAGLPNEAPRVVHGGGGRGVEVVESDGAGKNRTGGGIAALE